MIKSGFAGTCEPETAHFSRDPRICDDCLATNFVSSPISGFKNAVRRMVFSFTSLAAVVPGVFVLRFYHMYGWPRLLGVHAFAPVAGGVIVGLYWFGQCIYLEIGDRKHARRNPDESSREGERFYYLAVWAALNGRAKFGRRMLAQAKRMGFSDTTRLQDQTLSNLGT